MPYCSKHCATLLPLAGMRHGVCVLEALYVKVGIYLCRLEGAMSEELLYLAQVAPLVQHPRSEGMPEHMGRCFTLNANTFELSIDYALHRAAAI